MPQQITTSFTPSMQKLDSQIQGLDARLLSEILKIQTALQKNSDTAAMEMSVIFEEETERSGIQEELDEAQNDTQIIKMFCDKNVMKIKKADSKLEKLLKLYSEQLYTLCQDLTKWESKNEELKKKYYDLKKKHQQLNSENEDLKDQITTLSTQYLVDKPSQQDKSLFQPPREPKAPTACENQKWKQLSKKVNELKEKLFSYEEQISEKDKQIGNLTKQLKKREAQFNADEQKKKLKKSNTTLRGQKTILNNQIATLKKTLFEKNQFCEALQNDINDFKLQFKSMNETINFQSDLINDLRHSITRSQQDRELHRSKYQQKAEQSTKNEGILQEFLISQENILLNFKKTIDQIEGKYEKKVKQLNSEVSDLHAILDEKNDYIFRVKSQSRQEKQDNGYYGELVKNLTKKLTEKDDLINKLTKKQ